MKVILEFCGGGSKVTPTCHTPLLRGRVQLSYQQNSQESQQVKKSCPMRLEVDHEETIEYSRPRRRVLITVCLVLG